MGLVRGLAAAREIQEQNKTRRSSGSRQLFLKSGEEAVLRYFGDFEGQQDPVASRNHFVKRLQGADRYNNCGKNNDAPCVFCYLGDHGDKGIGGCGGGPNRQNFYVKDYRRQHRLDQEVRVLKAGYIMTPGKAPPAEAFELTKYPPCNGPNKPCQWCKQGSEAVDGGFMPFSLAPQYADQLVSLQARLRDYCRCGALAEGNVSTLWVSQYLCGNCNAEVEFYPENGNPTVKCDACNHVLPPLEVISCTNEDGHSEEFPPQRADLQDFKVRTSKTGSEKSTSFNFEPIFPMDPPTEEELEKAKEYWPKWEEILAGDPPEMQAAKLGVQNPFGQTEGHGAKAYGKPSPNQQNATRVPPKAAAPPTAAPKPAAPAPRPMPSHPSATRPAAPQALKAPTPAATPKFALKLPGKAPTSPAPSRPAKTPPGRFLTRAPVSMEPEETDDEEDIAFE